MKYPEYSENQANLRPRFRSQHETWPKQEENLIERQNQQERIAIAKRRAKLVERSIPDWLGGLECCTSLIKYAYLKVREAIFGTPPVPYEEFLPQESPPLTQEQHTRYELLIESVEKVRNARYKPHGYAFLGTRFRIEHASNIVPEALFLAINSNDCEGVQEEIERGVSLDAPGKQEWAAPTPGQDYTSPPLVAAMNCWHVNPPTNMAFTSPRYSTCHHFSIAELLINSGADVNKPNKHGYTPAYLAIYKKKEGELVSKQIRALQNILLHGGTVNNVVEDQDDNWPHRNQDNPSGTSYERYPIWEWALRLDQPAHFACIITYAEDFSFKDLNIAFLGRKAITNRTHADVLLEALKILTSMPYRPNI